MLPRGFRTELFRSLIDKGLKGNGDYGIVGIGVYYGQTLNVGEANDDKHVVLHSTYPFEFPYGQIVQVGVDAYRGTINVNPGAVAPLAGGPAVNPSLENGGNINDERIGTHFVLYPQAIPAPGGMELGPRSGTERSQDTR